jgi:AcrR family transcriptional regulator
MTHPDVSRRERKKDETRERIAHEAIRLFRQKGFEATTVDEIAAAADVAKGTFFNYFPRKEEVLGHFAMGEIEVIERSVDEAASVGGPATAGLLRIFSDGVASYERQPALWRATVLEMMRHATPSLAEANQRAQAAIRRLVELAQTQRELRRDLDPDRAANVLRGVFISTTLTWLHCPDPFDLGPEMRARLAIVFDGLAARRP